MCVYMLLLGVYNLQKKRVRRVLIYYIFGKYSWFLWYFGSKISNVKLNKVIEILDYKLRNAIFQGIKTNQFEEYTPLVNLLLLSVCYVLVLQVMWRGRED